MSAAAPMLVCAATGTEARACRRGIDDAGAADCEVLRTGVGPERAAEALARRLHLGPRPRLVVSSGFAGVLTAGLEQLSWVTARSVYLAAGGRAPEPVAVPGELLRLAPGAAACAVITGGEVLAAGSVRLPGPLAADMESAGLARVAAAAGVAFSVLRLVTDTPALPLSPLGRGAAAVLGGSGVLERAAHAARVAAVAARDPAHAWEFVRESHGWCQRLRAGWRERALASW